ncbi:MAG: hypothetical protein AAF297_07525 [Planctomycetota bacterium]
MTGSARRPAFGLVHVVALILAALAWTLSGCTLSADDPGDGPSGTRTGIAGEGERNDSLRQGHRGLEVRVWLAENDTELEQALAELDSTSPPINDAWARAGLQLRVLPIASLETLRSKLVTTGVRQSRWIGQPPTPVRLVQGPAHDAFDLVRTGAIPRPLDAGSAEAFARAWVMPLRTTDPLGRGLTPALAVELNITHRRATKPDPFGVALAERATPPRRLLSHAATLGPGQALLVIPHDPDARDAPARTDRAHRDSIRVPSPPQPAGPNPDRASTPETKTRSEPDTDNSTRSSKQAASPSPTLSPSAADAFEDSVQGPRPPPIPTLGELVLPTLPGPTRASTRRPVLVLVPRLPDAFPAQPSQSR